MKKKTIILIKDSLTLFLLTIIIYTFFIRFEIKNFEKSFNLILKKPLDEIFTIDYLLSLLVVIGILFYIYREGKLIKQKGKKSKPSKFFDKVYYWSLSGSCVLGLLVGEIWLSPRIYNYIESFLYLRPEYSFLIISFLMLIGIKLLIKRTKRSR